MQWFFTWTRHAHRSIDPHPFQNSHDPTPMHASNVDFRIAGCFPSRRKNILVPAVSSVYKLPHTWGYKAGDGNAWTKTGPEKISWKLDQRTFPILDDTSLLSLRLLLKGDGIIWGLINKSMNWGLINQRCILFTLRNKASWMISDQIITTSPRPHPEWWFSKAILYFKPRLVL